MPEPTRPEMDGESLLGPSSRSLLYNEYFYDSANRGVWTYAQIHDRHYSYTRYYDDVTGAVKFTEYYDLDADPRQLTNLLQDPDRAHAVKRIEGVWQGIMAGLALPPPTCAVDPSRVV